MSGNNTARKFHAPAQRGGPPRMGIVRSCPAPRWKIHLVCSEIAKTLGDREKKDFLRQSAYLSALDEGNFSAAQRIAGKFFPELPQLVERAKAMETLRMHLHAGAENSTLKRDINHAFSCGASLRAVATELSAHKSRYPENYAFSV